MCGIAGIFDRLHSKRPVNKEKLEAMSDEIAYRGRDGVGYAYDDGVGLAHRRLSIIDLEGGIQPMQDTQHTTTLIFNGMIYNFKDLRNKLISAGHSFKTTSDTEVLLNSYRAWGVECVKRFDGFFAFALYDKSKDILFCARDVLGKKPFYYRQDDDGFFYFASDLTALRASFDSKPTLSSTSFQDYLTLGFIPQPKTIFDDIFQLEPGQSITLKRGSSDTIFREFTTPYIHKNFDNVGSFDDATTKTEALLKQSVSKRLIADVPVGTLLSGGLDSGLITALIAKETSNVTAFTASFDDKNLDEAEAAADVAKHLGMKHKILKINDISESVIDDISVISSEPFADAAIIPLYLICKEAKKDVTVLLSGDGGDELFAGYSRYASFLKQENFKHIFSYETRQLLFKKLSEIYPQNLKIPYFLRAGASFEAWAENTAGGYLRNIAIMRPRHVSQLLSQTLRTKNASYTSQHYFDKNFSDYNGNPEDVINYARYADLKLWLPARMLLKADRASMAASIELRCPLLDLQLCQLALGIPYNFLQHPSGGKKILRTIAEKYLPQQHLMRPKQGFVMNIAHLLRRQWANRLEAVVCDTTLEKTDLFDIRVLKKMMKQHFSKTHDHSRILWAVIQLEAYLRNQDYL